MIKWGTCSIIFVACSLKVFDVKFVIGSNEKVNDFGVMLYCCMVNISRQTLAPGTCKRYNISQAANEDLDRIKWCHGKTCIIIWEQSEESAYELKQRITRLTVLVICRVWMFLADLDNFCKNEII